MEKKIARVIWSRGKYSDVYRNCIVGPSPLKQGQNVKVLWGKTKKEFSAVIECYPFETSQKSSRSEGTLQPRQAKVKRKLVSFCFRSNSLNECEFSWKNLTTCCSYSADPRITSRKENNFKSKGQGETEGTGL